MLLSENPTFEALEMNKTYRPLTFASDNQWILRILIRTPTDSALNVILVFVDDVSGSLNFKGFSQFLVVEFRVTHLLLITPKVFNSKPDSAQFNGIEFLYFVIVFTVFVFEGSCN